MLPKYNFAKLVNYLDIANEINDFFVCFSTYFCNRRQKNGLVWG